MRKVGCEGLDAILLTHWHTDHVGGVIDVLQALNGQSIPVFKRVSPCVSYQNEAGKLIRDREVSDAHVIDRPSLSSCGFCLGDGGYSNTSTMS